MPWKLGTSVVSPILTLPLCSSLSIYSRPSSVRFTVSISFMQTFSLSS